MLVNVLYLMALVFAAPVIVYRSVRHGRYRRGLWQKSLGLSRSDAERLRAGASRCIWLHAVSVGEVNLLATLSAPLRSACPDHRLLVSTSTDTGYDLAVNRFGEESVFFCPLDFTWSVRRTLNHLRPDALVLTELELWPNMIRRATLEQCPVMVVNGRLSQRSNAGYRKLDSLFRPTFKRLTWVGAQDLPNAERFRERGCNDVDNTGSLKFDGAPSDRDDNDVQEWLNWSKAAPWHRIWCLGSTQAGEESMGLRVYQDLSKDHGELRMVIVPRHPERFDAVAREIFDHGYQVLRVSEMAKDSRSEWPTGTVILVDTIGALRAWWGVCQFATVGGSFGDRGGQNMLEPAGYGCAVSFGPNTKNFRSIADGLLAAGGAVRVADEQELREFIRRCLDQPPAADALGRSAAAYVQSHQGATSRTIKRLAEILESKSPGEN
ncbi:MAG: 3-deoxy-D-manno-octulosonic acid transferase [Planctomycetota bacterium]